MSHKKIQKLCKNYAKIMQLKLCKNYAIKIMQKFLFFYDIITLNKQKPLTKEILLTL